MTELLGIFLVVVWFTVWEHRAHSPIFLSRAKALLALPSLYIRR